MKVLSFSCTKVHGYLSFNTKFNNGLTFLTGINGSGKTTAVRAIIALLTPSVRDLAAFAYDYISVSVENKGNVLTIYSTRTEESVTLGCSNTSAKQEVVFPVLKQEVYESRTRFQEREHNFYREQEAIYGQHPALVAVESLPTPMFLDLERRYQVGTRRRRDVLGLGRSSEPANPLAGSLLDSIVDAQKLAEEAYRHSLLRRTQLTDILKQNIILTAFDPGTQEVKKGDAFSPSWTLKQIRDIERVVLQSLRQIGIHDERIGETILPFFNRVRDAVKNFPTTEELQKALQSKGGINSEVFQRVNNWSAVQPQVRQINRLRELIEKYNEQVTTVFVPIERYKNSVNLFLEDSKKTINFSPEGMLRVKLNDYGKTQALEALSSGERQLVVILTHLAFNNQAQNANVLIIDEPELSLHLRWQELFVEAVIGASPHLQLILATHSPSIIKTRVKDCVDVQEAYSI